MKIFTVCLAFVWGGWISIAYQPCLADHLAIGVSHTRPPYIIQKGRAGIEIEIVTSALRMAGHHDVLFKFLTPQRVEFFLKQKKVDGIIIPKASNIKQKLKMEVFYSDEHLYYQNHAVTLSKNNLSVNSISDLMQQRVLGFQNAHKYLGPEFADMAKENPRYKEKPEQSTQLLWLFTGRTDVVIADKNIFLFHRKQAALDEKYDVSASVRFHRIFPQTPQHGVFLNKTIRDDFNEGLKLIRSNGEYDAIIKKYEEMVDIN
ncbi:MAG: transporter substrate-binding domain-containing protein [SAR324 cluster bacterium]|nr:transporter substrate-binding domain-containing protein [SAR324 cluster bacterium]